MAHMEMQEKADTIVSSSPDLPEFGFDDEGNPLRYIKFSGTKLKQLRKELGMTQAQLATELGVSRPLVTQYELGTLSSPTYELLRDLGRIFSEAAGHKIVLYVDWEENMEKAPDEESEA